MVLKKQITKEELRDFAIQKKVEAGKFPIISNWRKLDGFPCGKNYLLKLFKSYNIFRDYCEEPHILRSDSVSLSWLKSKSTLNEQGCWSWGAALSGNYGQLSFNGKHDYTHRIAYILAYGEIPENLLVRHKCDNTKCCNPDHLELGTHRDNRLDTLERADIKTSYNPYKNHVKEYKTIIDKLNYYLANSIILDNGCIITTVCKPNVHGYVVVSINNSNYMLHKLILSNSLNKDYNDINTARHLCNNKNCINQNHLSDGSKSDNAVDARIYSKNTKITQEIVDQIRSCDLKFDFKKDFDAYWANKFGVSVGAIASIRLGKSWTKR